MILTNDSIMKLFYQYLYQSTIRDSHGIMVIVIGNGHSN